MFTRIVSCKPGTNDENRKQKGLFMKVGFDKGIGIFRIQLSIIKIGQVPVLRLS
jgi:hypothetical protein